MQNLVPPNQGALPLPIPVMVAPNIPIYPHNNANFSPIRYQPVPGPGSSPVQAKRVPVQPKEPFPAALMPYLADKVASLNSGNLTWLIESLYRDLKAHGVKKISVEAKVREDCEKCPQRKVWVVKNSVLVSYLKVTCLQPESLFTSVIGISNGARRFITGSLRYFHFLLPWFTSCSRFALHILIISHVQNWNNDSYLGPRNNRTVIVNTSRL